MFVFTLLLLALALQAFAPKIANVFAFLLVVFVIFPIVTVSFGSMGWVFVNIFSGGSHMSIQSWMSCLGFIGVPSALAISFYVLS